METTSIKTWLRKRVLTEAVSNLLGAFATLSAALLTLGFVVCGIYVILGFLVVASGRWNGSDASRTSIPRLSPVWLCLGSIVVIILLFAGHLRSLHKQKERTAERRKEDWPVLIEREDPTIVLATDILFAGPRLAFAAVEMGRKSLRLMRLDVALCSRVLLLLLGRDHRISFREICSTLPELNPTILFPQLRDISGVVFLTRDPSGLTLTQELREEIRTLLGIEITPIGGTAHLPTGSTWPAQPDLIPIKPQSRGTLGLDPGASLPELERAYLRLMKENNPNRVAGLGDELETIAQEKAEDIYAAYRALLKKHDQLRPK